MSPEDLARVESGTYEEETLEAIDETEDEIDELTEQLVAHQIMSEARHEEIIERVNECHQLLENSSETSGAENPILTQVLNQLIEIRAELATLKSSMDSKIPSQSESLPLVVEVPESVVEDLPAPVSEETPEQEAEPEAKKRTRKVF